MKRDSSGRFVSTEKPKYHKGYRLVYEPTHARAKANGYVYEHVLVMERKIGRPLKKEEVVHHIDGNKTNNDPGNLMLYPNNAEHIRAHWKGCSKNKYAVNGKLMSLTEMSEASNQPYSRLYQRIKKLGWTPERAMRQ